MNDAHWLQPEASVLHADLDAFFASVEQRDDPRLRGRPVVVGAGVVLAASYQAKSLGVRSASSVREALRLCPEAIIVPPRFEAYVEASRNVFAIFRDTTPVVEPMSIDEAFLDVSGLRRLRGSAVQIAAELRARIAGEVGLPISIGVARTRYLAKIASASAKPDGLWVVPLGAEESFLNPLPVERLWGVGPVTTARLHAAHIRTVGQIAAMEVGEVTALLGRNSGLHLWHLAHGRDAQRVTPDSRRRSIGAQSALAHRSRSEAEIVTIGIGLVDRVTRRLRAAGRQAEVVTIRLRFGDFGRSTTSHTLARPTAGTSEIADVVRLLVSRRWPEIQRRGLTLLGITVGGLSEHPDQLRLPLSRADGPELDGAIDAVRDRFGSTALRRAADLGSPDRAQPADRIDRSASR